MQGKLGPQDEAEASREKNRVEPPWRPSGIWSEEVADDLLDLVGSAASTRPPDRSAFPASGER